MIGSSSMPINAPPGEIHWRSIMFVACCTAWYTTAQIQGKLQPPRVWP